MAAHVDTEQLEKILSLKAKKAGGSGSQPAAQTTSQTAARGGRSKKTAAPAAVKKAAPLPPVPRLDGRFNLDTALQQAYGKAVDYMNNMLQPNDLYVELQQDNGEYSGLVIDMDSQKTINRYDGLQILKLYAQNNTARGTIVNAKI